MTNPYVRYYLDQQQGRGMTVFHGSPWQLGHGQMGYGIGGLFRSISRGYAPLAKAAAKMLGKIVLHTAGKVMGDVATGRNLKEAVKSRGKEGLSNAGAEVLKRIQTGSGRKRKQKKTDKKRKPARSRTRNRQTKKRATAKKRKASTSATRSKQTKKQKTAPDIFG